ncbi:hypothetical protein K2173_000397 [Erythroxylum novogranatense]|uniref:DUF7815 domain-containing protein n=1 Tax=Erythroxylum novogranatense TaxID=1862640 RepID=A0AAV8SW59_9ROSI|nr:hypothetical protein K2173_000397 [Erythroxylum novogranatense]
MALEIPYDLINRLQISLRKEACFSSHDSSLPDFPSPQHAVSQLDPSPPYLRCTHCNARLLRGVNSIFCVFCGRQPSTHVPPPPINFTSTLASRWFLNSLDLHGSEIVSLPADANNSNRNQNVLQDEFPLSDLLDLEIRWPSVMDRSEIRVLDKTLDQKLATLNLAGVDLDNFFIDAKGDITSSSSEDQVKVSKHSEAVENDAFKANDNLSLFENAMPSKIVSRSKDEVIGDSFSGWEAEFQSVSSGSQHQETKLSDPFVGASSVTLSSHIDSVFGSGKHANDCITIQDKTSAIKTDDWFDSSSWNDSNAWKADQAKVAMDDKQRGMEGGGDHSRNLEWIHDNQWQTTSISKVAGIRNTGDDDSLFDAWNDISYSTGAHIPSDSSKKAEVQKVPSAGPASVSDNKTINEQGDSFDTWNEFKSSASVQRPSNNTFQEEPDFFSAMFNNQNDAARLNNMQLQTSVLDSMAGVKAGDRGTADFEKDNDFSSRQTISKDDDVDMLMSQMHDLSFMLENNLSVPKKEKSHGDHS